MSKKRCYVGDDFGGNDCTRCTFNFICPDYLDIPLCSLDGKICTIEEVKKLEPKYKIRTFDGDVQCEFSTCKSDGTRICQAFRRAREKKKY